MHLKDTKFQPTVVGWTVAMDRSRMWSLAFNRVARKYLSASRVRISHLISQIVPETGYLSLVKEIGGEGASYAPYFGRGLIQLTHLENYSKYGSFRAFAQVTDVGQFSSLGWNPDQLIAQDNGHYNPENCADSAGYYIIKRDKMLRHMDQGTSQENATTVSKDVNGYVAIENLNGLDGRLQAMVYVKRVLGDAPLPSGDETLKFVWRRNSKKENEVDPEGNVVMTGTPPRPKTRFYLTTHTISLPNERQIF